jgi:hypothetical protein
MGQKILFDELHQSVDKYHEVSGMEGWENKFGYHPGV